MHAVFVLGGDMNRRDFTDVTLAFPDFEPALTRDSACLPGPSTRYKHQLIAQKLRRASPS